MYFFRVLPDGDEWICKRGADVLDRWSTSGAAIRSASIEASRHRPSEVLLHNEDGDVQVVAQFAALDLADRTTTAPLSTR